MNIEIPRISNITVILRSSVPHSFLHGKVDSWKSYSSSDGHHRLILIQNNQKELKFFVCIQMSR